MIETEATNGTTIEQFQASVMDRRREAAGRYREVLARNEHPKPGDAQVLAEAMEVLGRTKGDLANDLELIRELARVAQAERVIQDLEKPLAKAKRKQADTIERAQAELNALKAKLDRQTSEAQGEYDRLLAQRTAAAGIVRQERTFSDKWTALVEAVPLDDVRSRRKRHVVPAERRTRAEVIDACRHTVLVLRMRPVASTIKSVVEMVDAELDREGHAKLTPEEEDQVRAWPLRGLLKAGV